MQSALTPRDAELIAVFLLTLMGAWIVWMLRFRTPKQ